MSTKIYKNTVPYQMRKDALRAIRTGLGLEAIIEANKVADIINQKSVYEEAIQSFIVKSFEVV